MCWPSQRCGQMGCGELDEKENASFTKAGIAKLAIMVAGLFGCALALAIVVALLAIKFGIWFWGLIT